MLQLCKNRALWKKAGGGIIKDWSKAMCVPSSVSEQECMKVPAAGGPFISGFSGGDYTCNVYARDDCRGAYTSVEMNGRFKFPGAAVKSFRCPCRKSASMS
jgi:hypothetical protein